MQIERQGSDQTTRAPETTFSGDVLIGGSFERERPSRLRGARVTYAPGARTSWKVNASGQTVIVLEGEGRAQREGQPVAVIRAGDVVWFSPGERHWEGASPDGTMTCVTLHEDGVEFLEAVSDEQCRADLP